MFNYERILKTDPTQLQEEIHKILSKMAEIDDPTDAKYKELLEILKETHKLNESETSHKRVSRDQILAAAVHIGGVLAIINYEKIHVITTKAGGMVLKSFR